MNMNPLLTSKISVFFLSIFLCSHLLHEEEIPIEIKLGIDQVTQPKKPQKSFENLNAFTNLPKELLQLILSFLDLKTLGTFSCTCVEVIMAARKTWDERWKAKTLDECPFLSSQFTGLDPSTLRYKNWLGIYFGGPLVLGEEYDYSGYGDKILIREV